MKIYFPVINNVMLDYFLVWSQIFAYFNFYKIHLVVKHPVVYEQPLRSLDAPSAHKWNQNKAAILKYLNLRKSKTKRQKEVKAAIFCELINLMVRLFFEN